MEWQQSAGIPERSGELGSEVEPATCVGCGDWALEVEPFSYPKMPWNESAEHLAERFAEIFPGRRRAAGAEGQASVTAPGNGCPTRADQAPSLDKEQWRLRIAAEVRQAEERGRSQGMEIGHAAGHAAGLAAGLAESTVRCEAELRAEYERLYAQAAELATSFSEERDRLLPQLERESVRLSLAIAARVLRREVQIDPLMLTGAVRVALGQLAQSTAVRLRVPAEDRLLWEEAMARMPGLPLRPQVIGDPGMKLGECRMETELGVADMGVMAQLKEIERGLFDRPGARAESAGAADDGETICATIAGMQTAEMRPDSDGDDSAMATVAVRSGTHPLQETSQEYRDDYMATAFVNQAEVAR